MSCATRSTRWPIDPRRVILTGISDGGTGVWDALKTWPQCFAAGVPMSGMTELAGLATIRDVPQWIFHGEKDNDTNIETGYGGAMVGSRAVVRALRAMGGAAALHRIRERAARDLASRVRRTGAAAVDARPARARHGVRFRRTGALNRAVRTLKPRNR